jgi:zinc protease
MYSIAAASNFYKVSFLIIFLSLLICASAIHTAAQSPLPEPGPVRSVNVPAVKETKLKNGLTIAVVEKKGVPIVSVQLLVRAGAASEGMKKAGLANLTADMLTKGTKTRTAEQIAEEMEFLGSSLNSGAGWNSSTVGMSVTSDKLDAAMAIMSDVVLNPSFKQEELDLLKSQTLDDLKYNLTQPGFLANYVASRWSYGEHPTGGTPASITSIDRADVETFFRSAYQPQGSVLIFVGDIDQATATKAAEAYFGSWKGEQIAKGAMGPARSEASPAAGIYRRLLVVDLPNSGQASVNYLVPMRSLGRSSKDFYPASVLNSLLGGGYSSRLNQEIRIKRGLSYGAGSSFSWHGGSSNFGARTQTKDVSAAEVAELIVAEIKRLGEGDPTAAELDPRKAVLTGGFGRILETNGGLAGAIADLYIFGIPTSELNAYMTNVNAVQSSAIKSFAAKNFVNGDIVIVGDYAKFKDDLAKRFPNAKIEVVKADEIDIESPTLRRSDIQ